MSHHAPTSRPKPPPPGSEEASSILNLGEFQHVDTLTLSEASLVINALVTKRKMDRKNINETEYVQCTMATCSLSDALRRHSSLCLLRLLTISFFSLSV